MRLCGVSTCFQVLSPGTGQVAHALLTRPPLGPPSLGFGPPPFDLHVLGAPPAFILSQDQTLMFFSLAPSSPPSRPPGNRGFLRSFSLFLYCSWVVFGVGKSLFPHPFCSLNYQSLPVVRPPAPLGVPASLPVLFWNFQGCITVRLSRCCAADLCGNSDMIPHAASLVNNFFKIFSAEIKKKFKKPFFHPADFYHITLTIHLSIIFQIFSSSVK